MRATCVHTIRDALRAETVGRELEVTNAERGNESLIL